MGYVKLNSLLNNSEKSRIRPIKFWEKKWTFKLFSDDNISYNLLNTSCFFNISLGMSFYDKNELIIISL